MHCLCLHLCLGCQSGGLASALDQDGFSVSPLNLFLCVSNPATFSPVLTTTNMYLCTAPSKPTLPSVLRGLLYAEFSSGRRPTSFLYNHQGALPGNRSSCKFRCNRSFSSSPKLRRPSQESRPLKEPFPANEPSKAKKRSQPRANTGHSDRKGDEIKAEKRKPESWQIQKEALQKKFKDGWNPPKKLSPDAIEGVRQLHAVAPAQFTTPVLAERFKVSPEVIRRILKSKWRPTEGEAEERRKRWAKRYGQIESQKTELGLRPMTKSAVKFSDSKVLYDDTRERPV